MDHLLLLGCDSTMQWCVIFLNNVLFSNNTVMVYYFECNIEADSTPGNKAYFFYRVYQKKNASPPK